MLGILAINSNHAPGCHECTSGPLSPGLPKACLQEAEGYQEASAPQSRRPQPSTAAATSSHAGADGMPSQNDDLPW